MIEAATSILAYLVLLLLTSWAARVLAKDTSVAVLFPFYGLMLLANLVYETSTGVLQTHKRFDRLAIINTFQSIITFVLILLAFLLNRSVLEVLAAYLLGKAFAGISITILAIRQMNQTLGRGWWRTSLRQVTRLAGYFGLCSQHQSEWHSQPDHAGQYRPLPAVFKPGRCRSKLCRLLQAGFIHH